MSENKENHHFVTKFYLRGFSTDENTSLIWVYERGRKYEPGKTNSKYSPRLDSIKNAGAGHGFYAGLHEDGSIDFNTYENVLEKKEKPSDTIFRKLRDHQIITPDEKRIFAEYVAMMLNRVPQSRIRHDSLWERNVDRYLSKDDLDKLNGRIKEIEKQIEVETDDAERQRLCWEQNRAQKNIDSYHKREIPAELVPRLMTIDGKREIELINRMTWEFLIAPRGDIFITSDNPIFLTEELGLENETAQISYPISKNIALLASWVKETDLRFTATTSQCVKEVNRRTAILATSEVYASHSLRWISTLLNKSWHQRLFLQG